MITGQQRPLLFADKEKRLHALDGLARPLWLGGLTNSQGGLEPRLESLAALRAALLSGTVPSPQAWHQWLPASITMSLRNAVSRLELAGYCANEPELTDTVLTSLLFHLDLVVDYQDRGTAKADAEDVAVAAFEQDWSERCGLIDELIEIFGQLPGDATNTRWSELRGTLTASGWQEVLRIRRLLETLHELARIIRALGRCRESDASEGSSRTKVEVIDRALAERPQTHVVPVPDRPGETRGIHRSDRIARMLPAEAVLLGNPQLRLVWHARRAERTLLGYKDDDQMAQARTRQATALPPSPAAQPGKKLERGPILVCVDTSGSMQGTAGEVAKAVVLEAMRSASAQGRRCHVFAFGASSELLEMELGLDADGIHRLTQFLAQSFHGGTDLCGPLEGVLAKLDDQQWQRADLLIASDGAFGIPPDLACRLDAAKRTLGLRVQGILIGDRETAAFLRLADDLHPIGDWQRYRDSQADGPAPLHRIIRTVFPNALSAAGTRQSTGSAANGAAAIR